MITKEESNLIGEMGVYGCWLLRHGRELPKDNETVQQLMGVYELFTIRPEAPTMGVLMSCIDKVAAEQDLPLGTDYETAFNELKEFRAAQNTA